MFLSGRRSIMRIGILVVLVGLVVAVTAAYSAAQPVGTTLIAVAETELREVAVGWSAKKQILGKDVYNDAGSKIGDVNDLIVAHSRKATYAIVRVGGSLGMGENNVAVPVSAFK